MSAVGRAPRHGGRRLARAADTSASTTSSFAFRILFTFRSRVFVSRRVSCHRRRRRRRLLAAGAPAAPRRGHAPGTSPPVPATRARAPGWLTRLGQPGRMVLRNVTRHPLRASVNCRHRASRRDPHGRDSWSRCDRPADRSSSGWRSVRTSRRPRRAAYARLVTPLSRLPGVVAAEPQRIVAARLTFEQRSRRESGDRLAGKRTNSNRCHTTDGVPVPRIPKTVC